jgi:hypothetical protein
MRVLLLFGVLWGVLAVSGGTTQATEGPWCLRDVDERLDCSQPDFDMCHFAALPMGAICYPNPNYHRAAAPQRQPARRARRPASRS